MVKPDIWRVHLDPEVHGGDLVNTEPVEARVDHYPNRFLVTFLRTGYVVASAQWRPEFKNGRGTWEVYGPDAESQRHYSTSDAVGAAYGFMLEFLERG